MADPWTQSPDRSTWVASAHGALLTVTRLGLDQWQPAVERGGKRDRGPTARTRTAAQRWAEQKAGERL